MGIVAEPGGYMGGVNLVVSDSTDDEPNEEEEAWWHSQDNLKWPAGGWNRTSFY